MNYTIANEQYLRGQMERLNGEPRYYGCHFGMRSTLEADRNAYYTGWNDIDIALSN